MNKTAFLAAVAASALIASPALAGGAKHSHSRAEMHGAEKMHHSKMHHSKAKHMKQTRAMHSHRHAMNAQRPVRDDWNMFGDDRRASWNHGTNTGFVPLDFATGVTAGAVGTAGAIAGGAVNTAGAIATAPFRDNWVPRDSYAYYNEPMMAPPPVSTLNGPTCQPGSWTTINGARMRCQ